MILQLILLIASYIKLVTSNEQICDSPIYCHGKLLHTVQTLRIFSDSKTFVDMKMKRPSQDILNNFKNIMTLCHENPTKEEIAKFVNDNFELKNVMDTWHPPDFNAEPNFLKNVQDEEVRHFAKQLVSLWPKLSRKLKDDVYKNPDKYSVIPVPNSFIIPGGRFQELYYWDSYWIVNGLLISEMYDTVKAVINNFIYMVKEYGFVPNGGRVYYSQRSQPPLLTPMAANYFKQTNDKKWLKENITYLAKELEFWLEYRTIQVEKNSKNYTLATYIVEGTGPRPESYYEDITLASAFKSDYDKEELYNNLKSAAQSGWDFSSRWIFDENGDTNTCLSNIQTTRVVPVDLNAFLYKAFKDISDLYDAIGNTERKLYWLSKADEWQNNIKEILWNTEDKIWYDYDIKLSKHRKKFYPSNVSPLWAGACNSTKYPNIGEMIVDYLNRNKIFEYIGGIPSSLENSGQQWDFPNAWPPLQAIVVQGLENSGDPEAQKLARKLAQNWVFANMHGYKESGNMYEKYDAVEFGKYGGGGEYETQVGFGWTNGIALEFINFYFTPKQSDKQSESKINASVKNPVLE